MEERYELIATRVPPGDNWVLVGNKDEEVIEGLVPTLTTYLRQTGFKGEYKLSPLQGELFAIFQEEVPKPEPQVWDLYGEY